MAASRCLDCSRERSRMPECHQLVRLRPDEAEQQVDSDRPLDAAGVMGPRRRTSAKTTPQRTTRVASVEISRQTARSAVGKSQLVQRTSNAGTVITDTISIGRGLSATAAAPETSIRETRASPRSLPGSPTDPSAGPMMIATSAARKIDRP